MYTLLFSRINYLMPLIIYSPYKCIVKNGQNSCELDQNAHLIIDNAQIVSIYPVGKSKRYAFNVDINEKNSKFYRIIEKDDKYLIFLLDGILSENVELYSFNYQNISSLVEISNSCLTFSTDKFKNIISLPTPIKDYKCGQYLHIIYFLYSKNDTQTMIAYNVKNNKAKVFKGDEIQLLDNGFKITSYDKGIYREINEDFIIDKDGVKNSSKTFTLAQNALQLNKLLVFNFISAIKNEDYSSAHQLLSMSLQEKINQEALKKYFGQISYFYLIDDKTVFAISNGENIIYNFSIDDKSILDITDNK